MKQVIRNILKDIRVELSDEFDRNFERQGFFSEAWQRRKSPTRPGSSILIDTGGLRKSIRSKSTDSSITFYSDAPHAEIHNEGGEIVVTKRMKMFFRHKFYEAAKSVWKRKKPAKRRKGDLSDGGFYAWTRDLALTPEAEFWRNMALMKEGKTIKIPRRQFLGHSPEVEQSVREIIEENLTEYFNHDFKV